MRRLLAAVILGLVALGGVTTGQGPAVGLQAGDDFCGDVSPEGNVCGDALTNDAVFGLRALDPFSFEFLSDTGGFVEATISAAKESHRIATNTLSLCTPDIIVPVASAVASFSVALSAVAVAPGCTCLCPIHGSRVGAAGASPSPHGSGVGVHSRARRWASATCSAVMRSATSSLKSTVLSRKSPGGQTLGWMKSSEVFSRFVASTS